MLGTINSACASGDIKIHWTSDSVWFDFGDATYREKKKLIKYITNGRKQNEFDAYQADEEGNPVGEILKAFPKSGKRLVVKRKPLEVKQIIEAFVEDRVSDLNYLVFEMSGKKGKILRPGEFKVKEESGKEEKKQEVVESKRPAGG